MALLRVGSGESEVAGERSGETSDGEEEEEEEEFDGTPDVEDSPATPTTDDGAEHARRLLPSVAGLRSADGFLAPDTQSGPPTPSGRRRRLSKDQVGWQSEAMRRAGTLSDHVGLSRSVSETEASRSSSSSDDDDDDDDDGQAYVLAGADARGAEMTAPP